MKYTKTIFTVFCLICATSATAADFSPAKFNFIGSDLNANITLSDATPEQLNVAVYCQSTILEDGKNATTHCYERSGLVELENQVEAALLKNSFTPAIAKGEHVSVRMNYRVIVKRDEQSTSYLLLPNLGSLQKTLGVNYSEPQELIENGWLSYATNSLTVSGSFFSHDKSAIRASATISAEGDSSEVKMIDTLANTESNQLKSAITQGKFVPGFVDGQPVTMGYLAILNQ